MTRDDLLRLADRVEREEPSRELAEAIARRLGWERDDTDNFWIPGPGTGRGLHIQLPFWLTSLDAAVSLMPEGWSVLAAWSEAGAIVNFSRKPLGTIDGQEWLQAVTAKTLAAALTAAALRAIAMEMGDDR